MQPQTGGVTVRENADPPSSRSAVSRIACLQTTVFLLSFRRNCRRKAKPFPDLRTTTEIIANVRLAREPKLTSMHNI